MKCCYYGCYYNEDGICAYEKASVKIKEARACHEDEMEDLE